MTQSHFSLSWDAHQKNICHGLSTFQQNGDFVDMTIAADGHMVKVHQVIIALASPYIKELIASANCPHPVVFLNNISYATLCSILEYIYTGEAMVAIEDLNKLAEAGQRLHIKGLDQMKINQLTSSSGYAQKTVKLESVPPDEPETDTQQDEICYFEIASPRDSDGTSTTYQISNLSTGDSFNKDLKVFDEVMADDDDTEMIMEETQLSDGNDKLQPNVDTLSDTTIMEPMTSAIQYTVSTQGSLQMILNRFIYYLKHTNRRDGTRQWRCVDYLTPSRCPAYVVTHEDTVLHREAAHTHFFHDKKIMKKVQVGAIFTAIQEAVDEGKTKKIHSTSKPLEEGTYQPVS